MQLANLQSLIQISFAICSAYLALDRFRYTDFFINLYKNAITESENILRKLYGENQPLKITDTTITYFRDKVDLAENGDVIFYFMKIKVNFARKHEWGTDVIMVSIFALLQIVLLILIATLPNPNLPYSRTCFWSSFNISIMGMLIPICFIHKGQQLCAIAEKDIKGRITELEKTHKTVMDTQLSTAKAKNQSKVKQKIKAK